ncbi:MAG: branched-chain amino acid ABC transporter permease [Polaromonas sp.]|nr:branched-chain amino acid ABC transporter permease [Polaromonas sp.]
MQKTKKNMASNPVSPAAGQKKALQIAVVLPVGLFILLAILPIWTSATDQPYYLTVVARMLIYAIAATALHLALGLGGLASLGHALFVGIGAYCVALPAFHGQSSGWVHIAWAIGSCALVAALTGVISLRTTGLGFLMITLAFAQMGYFIFVSLKQYGGDDGLPVAIPSTFFGWSLSSANRVYLVAYVFLVLLTWWAARLRKAPFGMVLLAAEQNARRVQALGLPVNRYRLLVYILSGVLCGIAGVLLANLSTYAHPGTFTLQVSGELIVMLVIGGIGYTFGPLIGALSFLLLEELLKGVTDHWMVILGPIIVLVALLGRGGLCGYIERWDKRRNNASSASNSRGDRS